MRGPSLLVGISVLLLSIAILSVGCDMTPTPPVAIQGKILLQFIPSDPAARATLEVSSPDGSNRQVLAEVAPDPGSVAVSPSRQYIAFFSAATTTEGTLTIQKVQSGETMFQTAVPPETSDSFRDALAVRYLAWSPDSQSLASVMNRDLHLVRIGQQVAQVLVRHRVERYNLAGVVKGSIGHPTWSTDSKCIVYDAFSPPDILSAGADRYRDVEYVDVSAGTTAVLLEDAHIAQQTTEVGKHGLILQHEDERTFFLLDLTTLKIEETTPLTATTSLFLCNQQNDKCVSIVSDQRKRDLLRLEVVRPSAQVHHVRLADLGEFASDCQFQSAVWSPDGATLLVTIGCPRQVELWSINASDRRATRLSNWTNVHTATLLSWFE